MMYQIVAFADQFCLYPTLDVVGTTNLLVESLHVNRAVVVTGLYIAEVVMCA